MSKDPFLIEPGVLTYTGRMGIDADGSPNTYGPGGGLDYLSNAGSPGNWYGIACDRHGQPYVQTDTDPHPGNYVSTTALQDHNKLVNDPARYVDSEKVNYVSVAGDVVKRFGVECGDFCAVYNIKTDKLVYAVVADVGPRGRYGEASIATARSLGIASDPKHGGCESGVVTVIFVKSKQGWPIETDEINRISQGLLEGVWGIEAAEAIKKFL